MTQRIERAARAHYPENKARHVNEEARLTEAKRFARTDDERERLELDQKIRGARSNLAAIHRKSANGDK